MFRRPAVAAIAGAVVLASAGGASAYWTITGSGSCTATVAEIKPLTIEAADIKGLTIEHAVPITGTVNNPNDFKVSLVDTHITVKVSMDTDHPKCNAVNFKVVAPKTEAKAIPANGSVDAKGGSIKMRDTNKDQSACMGAVLTLDYLLK